MNITSITSLNSKLNFRMNIIDMHTHLGHHMKSCSTKEQLDVFIRQPLPNNDTVEYMIVSDTDSFKGQGISEYDANKKALEELGGDASYRLMAGCAPHNGSVDQIKKIVDEHPSEFIGLKFHPKDASLPPLAPEYKPYFDYADEKGFPCLFHTHVPVDSEGKLLRNADGSLDKTKLSQTCDPQLIYEAAKKHPKTPFIMAHLGAGWNESHDRAIDVLVESVKKGDANLYADISWVDIGLEGSQPPKKTHIVKAIKSLMGIGDATWDKGDQSFRLMFGTDAPIARFATGENNRTNDYVRNQYSNFVDDIKNAIREDADLKPHANEIIENIFYNNAKKLFKLPDKNNTVSRIVQQSSNSTSSVKSGGKVGKIIAAVAGPVCALGGGAYLLNNNTSKQSH